MASIGEEGSGQFCWHKVNNWSDMDQTLKSHKLPKLTQHELDSLNSLITTKEIESAIKYLLKKQVSDGFTGNYTKHLKKED